MSHNLKIGRPLFYSNTLNLKILSFRCEMRFYIFTLDSNTLKLNKIDKSKHSGCVN